MNFVVTIDWKFVVALGAVAVGTIFAVKMDADAAERVSSRVLMLARSMRLPETAAASLPSKSGHVIVLDYVLF